MCPACILTIGGGLLVAKKLGVNYVLAIGLITIVFSFILDKFLRKMNDGKVFFPYQKIVIPLILLLIAFVVAKFLL
ncbi:hypothetical protein HZA76_03625 [Candidatus Roizmanbacteria bacterium]|nr:hypothetical protein [Candidatus Roizmanbacteria bacterium]